MSYRIINLNNLIVLLLCSDSQAIIEFAKRDKEMVSANVKYYKKIILRSIKYCAIF